MRFNRMIKRCRNCKEFQPDTKSTVRCGSCKKKHYKLGPQRPGCDDFNPMPGALEAQAEFEAFCRKEGMIYEAREGSDCGTEEAHQELPDES